MTNLKSKVEDAFKRFYVNVGQARNPTEELGVLREFMEELKKEELDLWHQTIRQKNLEE